jgi:hypothetical protein
MHRAAVTPLLALATLASLTFIVTDHARAQAVEPVFERAQQLVSAGHDSAGRAIVDSVLAVRAEGSAGYAEALFWRARLSRTAAAAERDYRRVSVEYPLSPRAPEALLLLAQLEMTRGDRASARTHLARLTREHPTGTIRTRASVTLARLAFDDGDVATGCAAVSAAREGLGPSDVELRNQLDYYGRRCSGMAAAASPAPPTGATEASAAAGAKRTSSQAAGQAPSSGVARVYSVQVAAYDTHAAADTLAKRLTGRGYEARVVGDGKPYRVRVGRYPTREGAAQALREIGKWNVRGVIVEAEPQ